MRILAALLLSSAALRAQSAGEWTAYGHDALGTRFSPLTQITRDDGWINTNPMDEGDTWHWDEIHNDQQDDNVVHFTLSAGQHTLEIAKREAGALLDAIVITDKLD